MKNAIVIGSGFSSLSASCYLATLGIDVTVIEKNASIGGRARRLQEEGFTFDMGPSWYWMPDIFEKFFEDFGYSTSDFYDLKRLDPAYRIYYENKEHIDINSDLDELYALFEKYQKGSSKFLKRFLTEAEENYQIAVGDIVYKPGISPLELVTKETVPKVATFFRSIRDQVRAHITHPFLYKLLEFPVLFLGAKPSNTPSLYNFMNYADLGLGTWYPEEGMYSVVAAMEKLALSLGVKFRTGEDVQEILVGEDERVKGVRTQNGTFNSDLVISGADYAHTEQKLLPKSYRQYSDRFWEKSTFAPSALLFYLGIDKKLDNVLHHTLFFDKEFDDHAQQIYDNPEWPDAPLFYASFASMTDPDTAPEGCENAVILVPLATGIEDTPEQREKVYQNVMKRLETITEQSITPHVIYNKSYCINDFVEDYNAYKGNAYGLANTLRQTAFLRPRLRSKKVKGLYFSGQLTVPGPGVPPALVSGKLVSDLIQKDYKLKPKRNEHQPVP